MLISMCASAGLVRVSTIILDETSQPPVVGGFIDNYNSSTVSQKGIIIGTDKVNMTISETDNLETVSEFRYLMGGETPITNKRCYDCTTLNAEQYALQLQHLNGNTDYYIRAFIKTSDNQYLYGNIEQIHTQSFNRYNGKGDIANVYYTFNYTLFDLMTDEIIKPSTDGFYYTTNENPTSCGYYKGTSNSICYKFLTKWNYNLWYCHFGDGTTWKSYDTGVFRPVMTFANNTLTVSKNDYNATDDITIYYSIDGQGNKPETFVDIYTTPLKISKACTVYCYAKRNDGNISFTNMYKIYDSYISADKYTITYKVDGEVYKVVTLAYGDTIIAEPNPVKDGYTFSGWSGLPTTMPAKNIEVTGSFISNGITSILLDNYVNAYSIDGRIVRAHISESKLTDELPIGLYIINGKKAFINKK